MWQDWAGRLSSCLMLFPSVCVRVHAMVNLIWCGPFFKELFFIWEKNKLFLKSVLADEHAVMSFVPFSIIMTKLGLFPNGRPLFGNDSFLQGHRKQGSITLKCLRKLVDFTCIYFFI